jgi:hypothetical protein
MLRGRQEFSKGLSTEERLANQSTSGPRGYALRFISGKYQGGEFPLTADGEIVIGRSSDLDMVLVEDMVSRKHAKISCSNGKITIEDLRSTNGTFVNGEKVEQGRLKEGDRILIGTSILKLVRTLGVQNRVDSRQINQELEAMASAKARSSGGSMSGQIEEVPIPDLLQLFSTSKKNGVLTVTTPEHEGRIYLRQGRIYYALIDGDPSLGPRKSFFRIIGWDSGAFELGPPDEAEFSVELDESTEALLMEGLRQLDELRKIEGELPPRQEKLALAVPLQAQLRELTPAQLDVLQAAINAPSVGAVLDRSPMTDRDAVEALLHLIKNDYLRPA